MAKKAIQVKKYKKSSSRYELEMFDIKLFTKFFIPFCRKWNFKTYHAYATFLFFIIRP